MDVLDEKLQNAKILGATHTINGLNEDVVDKIKVDILISSFLSVPGLWRWLENNVSLLLLMLNYLETDSSAWLIILMEDVSTIEDFCVSILIKCKRE